MFWNWVFAFIGLAAVLLFIVWPAIKIVKQWERGVVLRFGKLVSLRTPGFNIILPYIDQMTKVDTRVETLVVEPQEVITRDNVTIHVDAVVYYKVVNPEWAVVKVKNYDRATAQMSLTTLRSVMGESELDEVLAHRNKINDRLRVIIDEQTEPWGIEVGHVEVKDVLLPEGLQRAMARQAEAEREKRAKIIHADGEYQASQALVKAAHNIAQEPVSLQLRYLQTLVEMASERTNTIIPIPIDIMSSLKPLLEGTKTIAGNGS